MIIPVQYYFSHSLKYSKFRYGIFAFGYYGIGFELSVEATYPIDEGKVKYVLQEYYKRNRNCITVKYQLRFTLNIYRNGNFVSFLFRSSPRCSFTLVIRSI